MSSPRNWGAFAWTQMNYPPIEPKYFEYLKQILPLACQETKLCFCHCNKCLDEKQKLSIDNNQINSQLKDNKHMDNNEKIDSPKVKFNKFRNKNNKIHSSNSSIKNINKKKYSQNKWHR